MDKRKSYWILILSLIFIFSFSFAEIDSYRDNNIENNALTGRGLAMGNAIGAVVDNPDGLLLNPASMIGIDKVRVTAKSTSSMADVNQMSFMSIIPLNPKNIIGLAYVRVGVGDILIAEDTGTEIRIADKADYAESALLAGYSYKFNNQFSFGVTAKHYENKLNIDTKYAEQGYASGNDFDLGVNYRWDMNLNLSAGFKNISSALLKEGSIKWGNGFRESFDFGAYGGLSYNFLNRKALVALDVRGSKLFKSIVSAGVEYKLHDVLAIRGGYNSLHYYSCGLGINWNDFAMDYAYLPEFGTSADSKHYVSLSYAFNTVLNKPKPVNEIEQQILEYNVIQKLQDEPRWDNRTNQSEDEE